MLSDEEKKELLEGAASLSRRENFRKVRQNSLARPLTVDQLLEFLTGIGRCFGAKPPRPPSPQGRFLI